MFSIKNLEVISINLSNLCNMKCGICPNGHKHYYINKYNLNNNGCKKYNHFHYLGDNEMIMNTNNEELLVAKFLLNKTAIKIRERLEEIDYKGFISLTGFGEPLLNPEIDEIVRSFKGFNSNLITNGTYLTNIKDIEELATTKDDKIESIINKSKIENILDNISKIEISLHSALDYSLSSNIDDNEYYRAFYKIQELYGKDNIIIRNHNIYDVDNDLIVNNRNGALYDYDDLANSKKCNPNFDKLCYYPFYEIMIDTDGKYRFCAHDWNRRIDFLKDVENCSIEDFFIKNMNVIREMQVIKNKRLENLCGQCDANGRLHGENSFNEFKKGMKDNG